jgi:RNA polymerase sigma-70 factor (ECF subfamily)
LPERTAIAGDADVAATVAAAQRGEAAAFEALYAGFARTVHGIVLAHTGSRDADDLTQDVFCTVFQSLPQLRDPTAFPAFVAAIARNAARDVLRRRIRAPSFASADEVASGGAAPDADASDREVAARVVACIRTLPQAYHETLVLRLCEGLSGPEIAERTGLTHGSVRVNLTRGMALLRPLLAEAGLP